MSNDDEHVAEEIQAYGDEEESNEEGMDVNEDVQV